MKKKLFPHNRPYKFRLTVVSRGTPDSKPTRFWWRVNIHPTSKAMYDHIDRTGKKHSRDYWAMCSCPSRVELRKDGCLGELNFYWPVVGPSIVSHEMMHAVLDTLSYLKHFDLVPPRWYATGSWSNDYDQHVKRTKLWSHRQERAAYMMGKFMEQFHDECVKRGLWNK